MVKRMLKEIGTNAIETERLILRPFKAEDAADMFRYWTSYKEVTKYLSWQAHPAVAATEAILKLWLRSYDDPMCFRWAITVKDTGDHAVGIIDCVDMDKNIPSCEIGYALSKEFWGMGIMTEALRAVIAYMCEVGFVRIAARHNTLNPASGKVMLKAGMSFEGVLRKSDVNNQGNAIDLAWYSYINENKE